MILTDENKEQFWSHVKIGAPHECWTWQGCRSLRGYGLFGVRLSDGRRMNRNAQRVAWVITHGPIMSSRILVCHRCDNRPCVNPSHLFLGASQANVDDMIAKGRAALQKGESNNSAKLTDAQVCAIRAALKYPYRGINADLAREFGVVNSLISLIKHRRAWAHL